MHGFIVHFEKRVLHHRSWDCKCSIITIIEGAGIASKDCVTNDIGRSLHLVVAAFASTFPIRVILGRILVRDFLYERR